MAKLNFLGGEFQSPYILSNGSLQPNSGGLVYFYEVGTSTAKATYTDKDLTTPNANPVVLDSSGRAKIWFTGDADGVLKDSAGNTIYTDDNINPDVSTTASNYNLVLNGSFEDDTNSDGTPDEWDLTSYTGATNALVTDDQEHGLRSFKFSSVGNGGGYLTTTSYFEVAPSTDLYINWVLKSSVAGVRNVVELLYYTSAQASLSTATLLDQSSNPTTRTKYERRVTPPATARFAKLRIYGCHSSDSTVGATWYDDIVVSRATPIIGIGLMLAMNNKAVIY